MERDLAVVHTDDTNGVSEAHSRPLFDTSLGEIGVRRPQPSVVYGDGSIPHDHTTERDTPVTGGTNQRACRSGDIDAPMPAVSPGGKELANDRAGDRPDQSGTGG